MSSAIQQEENSVQPLISIGMPVYNGEPYLEAAIRSNLEQTFGDFELIICDNASTDATAAICRDLAALDKRIRYVRNDRNLGAAANYNKVFELARGQYFRWSNADDIIDPRLLARTLEVLGSRSDAVIAYGLTRLIDAEGKSLGLHCDNLDLQHERPSDRYRAFYRQVNLTNIIYGLMRASAMRLTPLMGSGSFPSADVQFMASMALLGKFIEIPEVLFHRRMHKGAMSVNVDQLQYRTFWAASNKVFLLPTWRYEIAGLQVVARCSLPFGEKTRLLSFSAKRLWWRREELSRDLLAWWAHRRRATTDRTVIGVLGHFGNRNLGDESIIAASLEQIRRRMKDAETVCFSLRPNDTAFRHGVETFPVRHSDDFSGPMAPMSAESEQLPWKSDSKVFRTDDPLPAAVGTGWRQRLKAFPVVGSVARLMVRVGRCVYEVALELRFSIRAVSYLRRIDLLVIAGSNQFLDNFGGLWAFPYGLLRWTALAKLTGAKVAFVSVGAGPLEAAASRLLVRCAIRLADFVSYRDMGSKRLVEAGRPKVDGRVFPDLAFGLSRSDAYGTRSRDGPPVIGINPMPVFDSRYWFEHDQARYLWFVDNIAAFATRLVRAGNSVFLFPTMWRDDDVIRDVISVLSSVHGLEPERDFTYKTNDSVRGLIQVMQGADIIVATRFHASVLAYHLGLPVLGIGYYRKTLELMEQMGQGQYYVPLEACDVNVLWEKFLELDADRLAAGATIARRAQENRRRVEEQWDEVLGLVGFERPARSHEQATSMRDVGAR